MIQDETLYDAQNQSYATPTASDDIVAVTSLSPDRLIFPKAVNPSRI